MVAEEKKRQVMGTAVGTSDPALVQELLTLGFTPDTVRLMPLAAARSHGRTGPSARLNAI